MSINRVNITGNLTRDPELRQSASGTQVLSFGVAVNDRRKNQQTGEWEDYPNFIDCTLFGKRAESLSRFLRKGMLVAVEGKLHWSSWEKDGQKRTKVDVNVDDVIMMQRSEESRPPMQDGYYAAPTQGYAQPQPYAPQPAVAQQYAAPVFQPVDPQPQPMAQTAYAQGSVYDEDIPF